MRKKVIGIEGFLLSLPALVLVSIAVALHSRSEDSPNHYKGQIKECRTSTRTSAVGILQKVEHFFQLSIYVDQENPLPDGWGAKALRLKSVSWITTSGEACTPVVAPPARFSFSIDPTAFPGMYILTQEGKLLDIPDFSNQDTRKYPGPPRIPEFKALEVVVQIEGAGVRTIVVPIAEDDRTGMSRALQRLTRPEATGSVGQSVGES